MGKANSGLKKVVKQIGDAKKRIDSIDLDVHWYRRVFHTFGASFLVYYLVPSDEGGIGFLKFWVPILILLFILILEGLRIVGKISSNHFFGLRMYEEKRVGSYVFFGVAIFILLLFFPQHIAVHCILCACIADPLMGEIRNRFQMKHVYVVGFLICLLFFVVSWYKSDVWVMVLVSIVGTTGAVIGETKKFWWLDDDFMIQMLPALLILILWVGLTFTGVDIIPSDLEPVIHPIPMSW